MGNPVGKFMKGIYLITNIINNKKYVGQSTDIQRRWKDHIRFSSDQDKNIYCPKLYRAINKYGIDNFKFEVLEDLSSVSGDITEREEYWIKYYDTVNSGYNSVYPTKVLVGENNPNVTLTYLQVLDIMDLLRNSKISQQDIAKTYGVAASTIYRINRGEAWFDSTIDYPIRKWNELGHYGEKSGKAKIPDEEVIKIRNRYVNETVTEIWQDYKDIYSLSGFKKVCQGVTYKHLPVYNKTTKTWNK